MEEEMKRYYVDFYDAFDSWGGTFEFYPERLFDDLDKAKECCIKLQSKLYESNKKMGEHYGVIDGKTKFEVFCCRDKDAI